jgi:hypothetical protein
VQDALSSELLICCEQFSAQLRDGSASATVITSRNARHESTLGFGVQHVREQLRRLARA